MNDVRAANVVFASGVRVWQIPMNVYRLVSVGYAELDEKVARCRELGAYLTEQLKEFNAAHENPEIEHRSLGDSPAVSMVVNPRAQSGENTSSECSTRAHAGPFTCSSVNGWSPIPRRHSPMSRPTLAFRWPRLRGRFTPPLVWSGLS